MYQTSNAYQSAIKAAARYIRARLSAGDKTYTDETEINTLTLETGGTEKVIGNAYSAKLTAELQTSDVPVLGAALHAVFWPNGQEADTVPTAPFVLESVDYDADAGVCAVTGYDRMVRLAEHTAAEIDITYPTTIGAYAAAAAALAGLELAGVDWLNADTVLTAAPNLAGTETCREVIAWAAEAALGNAHIDRDGKIVIRSIIPAETGYLIDPDLYFESEIGSAYGPINTLVLARLPQNDNVYRSSAADDAQKIALTITDNPFLDAIRDDVIDAMFAQIDGVSVQPYTLDWCGDPALDPGDTITLTDTDGAKKVALYGGATLEFDGGMRAAVEVTAPTNETIQYQKASSTHEALRKTQLAVDKANQKIESLVQEIETLPALNLALSRDNAVVFVSASGTPDLSAASVTLTCTLGGVDQTDAAEITFAPVGLTGSYDDATHTYTVTAMMATTGYVTITAAYDWQTVSRRYTVVQVRDGADGDPGAPGKDGTDGVNGAPGKDGVGIASTVIEYQQGDSGTVQPSGTWQSTIPDVPAGKYLWTRVTYTYTDASTHAAYTVGMMGQRGLDGAQGKDGADGIDGAPGTDGKTSYFHIKYSPVESPTAAQMTETPSTYIGTYVDFTPEDSDDPADYTWARFEGIQGKDGADGIPGTNGADGKTQFLHIAYATSADGSTEFSTTSSVGKTYIGTCVDFDVNDPTTAASYKWSKIKGETGAKGDPGADGAPGKDGTNGKDGVNGADGISVTALTAHYAASSSGDTAPTDGWSDTMPERDDTQYLWGYYTVLFSNGTTQDTVPYVVAGAGETYTELTNQLQTVVHEYNTKIDQTKAEILQTASETYATAESFSKLETKVEQTAQQIEFRFSDANGRIQDVSDALSSNQKLLEEYIRFKGALMELGRSDSDFIAKLSNERLSFYEGSNEIAYISNNALNITDAQIRRRLSISYVDDSGEIKYTYDWIVRSNGHITLARRR